MTEKDDYDHGIGDMIQAKKEFENLIIQYKRIMTEMDSTIRALEGYAIDCNEGLGDVIDTLESNKDDLLKKRDELQTKVGEINIIKSELEQSIENIAEKTDIFEDYENSEGKLSEIRQDYINQIDRVINDKNIDETLDLRLAEPLEDFDKIERQKNHVSALEDFIRYLEEEGNTLDTNLKELKSEIEATELEEMDNELSAHYYDEKKDNLEKMKNLLVKEIEEFEENVEELGSIV